MASSVFLFGCSTLLAQENIFENTEVTTTDETEKTEPAAATNDGQPVLPTGPSRAAVLVVRQSQPQTAVELVKAIQLMIHLGEWPEAKHYLVQLLQTQPDETTLNSIGSQFGDALFIRLLRHVDLQPEGFQLGDAVLEAVQKTARDPQRLNQLSDQILDINEVDTQKVIGELRRAGSLAVSPLVTGLLSEPEQRRHQALLHALWALGDGAIDPLIGILESDNIDLRIAVISVLGQLRSARAVPFLLRPLLENSADSVEHQAARAALLRMTTDLPSRTTALEALEHEVGNHVLGSGPFVPDETGHVVVWQWNDQQQTCIARHHPTRDAAMLLAARLAHDWYLLEPINITAKHAMLTTGFAAEKILTGIDEPLPRETGTAYERARRAGTETVLHVLLEAARQRNWLTAVAAAEVLGEIGDARLLHGTSGHPAPLVKLLESPDARLRFTLAQTVLRLSSHTPFAGSSYLTETLVQLVRSTASRRVLLAHPNLHFGGSMVGLLAELGLTGDLATTGHQALRTSETSSDYEYVIVSATIGQPHLAVLLQRLRESRITAELPIAILARPEDPEPAHRLAATDEKTIAVSVPRSSESLRRVVNQLEELRHRHSLSPEQRLLNAKKIMELLAELAQHDENRWLTNLHLHQNAWITGLDKPELTAAAAKILGHIGSPQAQLALVNFAGQLAQPLPSRQIAADAFHAATKRRGVLLASGDVALQYHRYNQSARLDKETQAVLSFILDTIELKNQAAGNP